MTGEPKRGKHPNLPCGVATTFDDEQSLNEGT